MANEQEKLVQGEQDEAPKVKRLNGQARSVNGGNPNLMKPDETEGNNITINYKCGT